jgi:phage regulator Rha-like protein
MTSNTLTLTPINGEPRVHDLHLAERLGFAEPRAIRKIIKRNEAKLLSFGTRSTVSRVTVTGQPSEEYYLNQRQAIFICMKSETERAFDVQVEIVRVFDAYLNGELKPSLPQSYAEALRLYADQVERNEQQQREIEASRPKVAFHDQVVSSETLIDFTEAFSLLQRRTGQRFTRRTFLEFCRRHAIACQPNPHAGIGADRFVPRKDYVGTWFVSEMHPNGVTEWMLRPMALAGIVQLIEWERQQAIMNPRPMLKRLDDGQEAA